MTRHVYFGAGDSGCERFLAAPLWDEPCGGPLSVMSAFARLGLEPWSEAGRLMHLSPHGAASALAASLSQLPTVGGDLPDYAAIAAQLVTLLPERRAGRAAGLKANKLLIGRTELLLLVAAVAVILLQMKGYLF